MNRRAGWVALLSAVTVAGWLVASEQRRPSWTTSRVVGTPEPPPPYIVERVYPKLGFKLATTIQFTPEWNRILIGLLGGQVVTFVNSPDATKTDEFLDLKKLPSCQPSKTIKQFSHLYDVLFHPEFAKNRYCYICYTLDLNEKGLLNSEERVSRFTVLPTDPPRCDPASEQIVLAWKTGGHNGGCLRFGPDGFLYISTGDAASPSPPDPHNTGQDISDLLSSVLRIDVNRTEDGRNYAVPADNPFVSTPNARPEVWAYGFRNPWKMHFDRKTGDLWLGDVGWELYEMVYRVTKGGNYGWSITEGRQPVSPEGKRGPTPIIPPALEFPHSEAASITGGLVYHGKRFPELEGKYICGDWLTHKLWATRFDGDRQLSHQEIAQGREKIIAFAEDREGELYYLDYDDNSGGIYTLTPNPAAKNHRDTFPRKLSETGLFADTVKQLPAPGVVPYRINAEPWADGATSTRLAAMPETTAARVYDQPERVPNAPWFNAKVHFPEGAVLAKTIGIETTVGDPKSYRRIETQIMHFTDHDFRGYSYRWNDEQTDAVLVPATGATVALDVRDPAAPGGTRHIDWHIPGRSECRQCHNPWAGNVLSFVPNQLKELEQLRSLGVVTRMGEKQKPIDQPIPTGKCLVDPYGTGDLTERARSYLHVNCSHCHQFGAGGTARIDLRYDTQLKDMQALDQPPAQGAFDMPDGRLIAPGDPNRSVMVYRMAKLGSGRMPHIGSHCVDERAVKLMRQWVGSLAPQPSDTADLDTPGGRAKLLGTTCGAMRLAEAIDTGKLSPEARTEVVTEAAKRSGVVRDLFERYLPDNQRVKRLGVSFRPETVLALKGEASRGKELFFKAEGMRCASCHRVGSEGGQIGPELDKIGGKYSRGQLLTEIVEPSKNIDPKFASFALETTDGKVVTGLQISKTDTAVTVRDAQGKDVTVSTKKIASLTAQKLSLMPEQLLRDLTAQQAADLLAYLETLK